MKGSATWSCFCAIGGLICAAQFCNASAQIVEILTSSDWNTPSLRLEISRGHRQVTLYRGNARIKTYHVAVGRPGWETPLGDFQVFQMIRDPDWKHPLTGKIFRAGEMGNELGHYWIGFWTNGKISVGFHGTPHPQTVGKSISHGCIRMYDKDIEELFDEIDVGDTVRVVP